MPGLNKDRKRSMTLAFRVSPEEAAQIEARIAVSGLQKQEYLIESLLHNRINIRFGKYEGDMLGVAILRLQKEVSDIFLGKNEGQLFDVLTKCEILLSELCSLMKLRTDSDHLYQQEKGGLR